MVTKNKLKPLPKKQYYTAKLECMLPATITYRVLAENPEQALTMLKTASPQHVQYKLIGRKNLKATIYDAGTVIIRLVKHLVGVPL